jgi:hypothetical protein
MNYNIVKEASIPKGKQIDVLDLNYIVTNCPPIKIIKKFLQQQIDSIEQSEKDRFEAINTVKINYTAPTTKSTYSKPTVSQPIMIPETNAKSGLYRNMPRKPSNY